MRASDSASFQMATSLIKPVMSSSGKGQSLLKSQAEVQSAWDYSQAAGRVGAGIALDDHAMGHYIDGKLARVVCSSETAAGYLMAAGSEAIVAGPIRIA